MALSHRARRVEELIKDTVSEIIQRDLKDPRLPMIFSVTRVRVTPDLQQARVLFSQLPDDDEAVEETYELLESARGYIRRELGHRITLRYVPELEFSFDPSVRETQRISQLISESEKNVPDSGDEPNPSRLD
ncbi:MAG: 30S ribosome-binding factor RbfA [Sumerlaeia bacterium]